MLVSNPQRFVIIPNIDEEIKFVIAHQEKDNISPKETSAITTNGKHIITPSSGFNAMREVEVDVNIGELTTEEKVVDITNNGEVEILPTNAYAMTKVTANVQVPTPALEEKQVTITKAKTTEIITPDADVYGLSKVEVSTDIPLESKQITITENGTTTIEASEGFEGIESVEVTTDVNDGLDFSEIYDAEQANEINLDYKKWINYAKAVKSSWDGMRTSFNASSYFGNPTFKQIMYFPKVDWSNVKTVRFDSCYALKRIYFKNLKPTNADYLFFRCLSLEGFEGIDFSECTSMVNSFGLCGYFGEVELNTTSRLLNIDSLCMDSIGIRAIKLNTDGVILMKNAFINTSNLEKIELTSIKNVDNSLQTAFISTWSLKELYLTEWKSYNITLTNSDLIPKSIHYIIQNAMNVVDGATARTLTITATAKTNWQNSEYYEQDLAVLSTKGITIA